MGNSCGAHDGTAATREDVKSPADVHNKYRHDRWKRLAAAIPELNVTARMQHETLFLGEVTSLRTHRRLNYQRRVTFPMCAFEHTKQTTFSATSPLTPDCGE